MYNDFCSEGFMLKRPLALDAIQVRLAGLGKMVSLGPRGFRFIPEDRRWPPTYFNPDGSFEVIMKDLDYDDVLNYVDELSLRLGVEVLQGA